MSRLKRNSLSALKTVSHVDSKHTFKEPDRIG